MTIEADPLDWEDLPAMATIEEVRRFLRCSDHTAREFCRDNSIYLKINGGTVRIPKKGLAEALGFLEEDLSNGINEVVSFEEYKSANI